MRETQRTAVAAPSLVAMVCLLVAWAALLAVSLPVSTFTPDGWFESSRFLFRCCFEPASNSTPIGAPAVLYFMVRGLAWLLGGREFTDKLYAAHVAHQLLVASCALAFVVLGRALGARLLAPIAGVAFILLLASTGVSQLTYSENVLVPLETWALVCLCLAVLATADARRRALRLAIAAGVLYGFGAGIKPTLVVVLAPLTWFVVTAAPGPNRRRILAGVWCAFALVMVTLMGANVLRFGRFELADSWGRHLWNAVRLAPDEILGGHPNYVLMRQVLGVEKLRELKFWQLRRVMAASDNERLRQAAPGPRLEEFLRPMILDGIRRHPTTFVAVGLRQTGATFFDSPPQYSLVHKPGPLDYDAVVTPPLPPLSPRLHRPVGAFLNTIYKVSRAVYPVGLRVFLLGAAAALVWLVVRRLGDARVFSPFSVMRARVLVFLALAFLMHRYAMCQVETFSDRYSLILLSAVFTGTLLIVAEALDVVKAMAARRSTRREGPA